MSSADCLGSAFGSKPMDLFEHTSTNRNVTFNFQSKKLYVKEKEKNEHTFTHVLLCLSGRVNSPKAREGPEDTNACFGIQEEHDMFTCFCCDSFFCLRSQQL